MMAYINRTYPPAPFLLGKGSKALLMALSEWIAPWKPKPPHQSSRKIARHSLFLVGTGVAYNERSE